MFERNLGDPKVKKQNSLHQAPIRRWIVLGVLLALPAVFVLAQSRYQDEIGPARSLTGGVSPAGGTGCDDPTNPVQDCGFESGDFALSPWG